MKEACRGWRYTYLPSLFSCVVFVVSSRRISARCIAAFKMSGLATQLYLRVSCLFSCLFSCMGTMLAFRANTESEPMQQQQDYSTLEESPINVTFCRFRKTNNSHAFLAVLMNV